ncbi:MAG TPA: ribonuclease PH [Candidatus Atribacteria bacterium]|nr:ribonuclease PH [Atribacterota bacterium]HOA99433.1 ribonuclease PH [Candidatus Atribacteria bacterium]MDI9606792.1 ribonuclease PH [Atribacterota bacterium]HOQ51220.1 ribonuclease PH [Candidatus Atribacteria bacterium]HPT63850.1 ribonuclease PH [Candidatus Atribacteria bacterium]
MGNFYFKKDRATWRGRPDGRQPDELRPVEIRLHYLRYAEGSVLVEAGNNRIICAASVEDRVPPFLRNSGQGWITAEYSMLPRATTTRSLRESIRGQVGGRTHEIQRLVGRALRSVVDLERLGERTIMIDCDVIQADGGTRTWSITGAFIALVEALWNCVDRGILSSGGIVKDYLGAISVGVVGGQELLDLAFEEDSAAQVDMNVVMTGSGDLVEVQGTAEGDPFSRETLNRLLDLAQKGVGEIIVLEKKLLKRGLP